MELRPNASRPETVNELNCPQKEARFAPDMINYRLKVFRMFGNKFTDRLRPVLLTLVSALALFTTSVVWSSLRSFFPIPLPSSGFSFSPVYFFLSFPSSSFFWRFSTSPLDSLSPSPATSARIPIVTTIFPLQEFARAVAGERGEVILLLPPGASVHNWQPRAVDIRRLSRARLFITIGAGLEPWANDILRSLPTPGPEVLAAAEFLDLNQESSENTAHGHAHAFDPHVWLDFSLAQLIVKAIAQTLARLDPAGAAVYQAHASSFNARLEELDHKFEVGLHNCLHRTLLVGGHAAFGYLARKYNLEQIALYGLSPDAEPAPGWMISVVEKARQLGLKTVFIEANTSARTARALAREIGAEPLVLNPGASPTRQQLSSGATFFDIMEENLRMIRKGLGCE